MKRILYDPAMPGNTLYTSISDMRNLELAHINASRGKGWYPEVIRVNKNPQEHFRKNTKDVME